MALPQEFLDTLRARVGLAEVIGKSVKLVRRGREYHGLCPFHDEKSPSFTVNEQKGFYHCFGCGAHGDVISFVMNANGMSFRDAVESLAAGAGLEVPRPSAQEAQAARRAAGLQEVVELACGYFERCLRMPEGRAGHDYLHRRGLDAATITAFRLGYAPAARGGLKSFLAREGVEVATMIEAGLVIAPEDGGRAPYDRFRDRVIFPIRDRRGRVVGFGGRLLGEGKPKYLNSPETPLFHKGRLLYGLPEAQAATHDGAEVIVTEGYMDVIALHRGGFRGAVAPLGTALGEDQLAALWRLGDEPVICLDGDEAGRRAAKRVAVRALPVLRPGKSLRLALLPPGEDPDSLIAAAGGAAMRAVLDRALPLVDVVWGLACSGRRWETPEQRAAIEAAIEQLVAEIADDSVQRHYRRALRDRYWQAFGGKKRPSGPVSTTGGARGLRASGTEVRGLGRQAAMRALLAAVINHPQLHEAVGERLGATDFPDSALDKLRRAVLILLDAEPGLDPASLQDHLIRDGYEAALTTVVCDGTYVHAAFAKPGSPFDTVREGWEQVYAVFRREDVSAEQRRATARTVAELSEESWERLNALQRDFSKARDHSLKLSD